jgi:hypothetical protein
VRTIVAIGVDFLVNFVRINPSATGDCDVPAPKLMWIVCLRCGSYNLATGVLLGVVWDCRLSVNKCVFSYNHATGVSMVEIVYPN